MKDELEYAREAGLLEMMRVTLLVAGLSEDGSCWCMCNEFYRSDGKLAARVTSSGGWLRLVERRLTTPPDGLLAALKRLPPSSNFQNLSSSVKA